MSVGGAASKMMRTILRILVRDFSQVSVFCQNQNLSGQYVELCRGHLSNLRVRSQTPSIQGLGTMFPAACQGCQEVRRKQQSPYRLVVRTSRCGRDNPGSTPGGDIWKIGGCHTHASLFFAIGYQISPFDHLCRPKQFTRKPGQKRTCADVRVVFLFRKSPTCKLNACNVVLGKTRCLLSYAFESEINVATEILSSIAFKGSIDAPMV